MQQFRKASRGVSRAAAMAVFVVCLVTGMFALPAGAQDVDVDADADCEDGNGFITVSIVAVGSDTYSVLVDGEVVASESTGVDAEIVGPLTDGSYTVSVQVTGGAEVFSESVTIACGGAAAPPPTGGVETGAGGTATSQSSSALPLGAVAALGALVIGGGAAVAVRRSH